MLRPGLPLDVGQSWASARFGCPPVTCPGTAPTEWHSLQRLLTLVPPDATVWPGHDYGVRPSSTIALETETNPFLLCPDETAFLRTKAEWPQITQRLGLK